nr:MAG TPA: hypothetical protein [Caudoviricetes sp.]
MTSCSCIKKYFLIIRLTFLLYKIKLLQSLL